MSKKKKFTLIIIILIIILCLISLGIFLYWYFNKAEEPESIITENEIIETEETTEDIDANIIGYLSIEAINLNKASIAEGTDDTILETYIGHFSLSAYQEGNVALCAHNRGYNTNYFENLKYVTEGDTITYETIYQQRNYIVTEIKEIESTDIDVIETTNSNQITLITCVENKSNLRLCVIGVLEDYEVIF